MNFVTEFYQHYKGVKDSSDIILGMSEEMAKEQEKNSGLTQPHQF